MGPLGGGFELEQSRGLGSGRKGCRCGLRLWEAEGTGATTCSVKGTKAEGAVSGTSFSMVVTGAHYR